MNSIAQFRKCTLSDKELFEKVDEMTDSLFDTTDKTQRDKTLVRHIPAQPNNDFDLLIGELLIRFAEAKNLFTD